MTVVKFHPDFRTFNPAAYKGSVLSSETGAEIVSSVLEKKDRAFLFLASQTVVCPLVSERDWSKVVDAQFGLFSFLKELGLFTMVLSRVSIPFKNGSLSTYCYPGLEKLAEAGTYFIDPRADKYSSWKNKGLSFFETPSLRLDPKAWNPIFSPLLTDLAKLIVYGFPINDKFHSLAIVKEGSDYHVRYFFDEINYKTPQTPRLHQVKPEYVYPVKRALITLVGLVLVCEFKKFALNDSERQLLETLAEDYSKKVMNIAVAIK